MAPGGGGGCHLWWPALRSDRQSVSRTAASSQALAPTCLPTPSPPLVLPGLPAGGNAELCARRAALGPASASGAAAATADAPREGDVLRACTCTNIVWGRGGLDVPTRGIVMYGADGQGWPQVCRCWAGRDGAYWAAGRMRACHTGSACAPGCHAGGGGTAERTCGRWPGDAGAGAEASPHMMPPRASAVRTAADAPTPCKTLIFTRSHRHLRPEYSFYMRMGSSRCLAAVAGCLAALLCCAVSAQRVPTSCSGQSLSNLYQLPTVLQTACPTTTCSSTCKQTLSQVGGVRRSGDAGRHSARFRVSVT